MSAEKALASLAAKNRTRAVQNFHLGAANVSNKRSRRDNWADAFDQIDNRADGSCKQNQITALHSLLGIFRPGVQGSHFARALQHMRPIAADDADSWPGRLHRHAE